VTIRGGGKEQRHVCLNQERYGSRYPVRSTLFVCPKHKEARHHLGDLTLVDTFNFKKGNDSLVLFLKNPTAFKCSALLSFSLWPQTDITVHTGRVSAAQNPQTWLSYQQSLVAGPTTVGTMSEDHRLSPGYLNTIAQPLSQGPFITRNRAE